VPTVTALARYPVKSCRGEWLDAAAVEPWGLAGDRRWMVVDDDGETVTARTHPSLLLAVPDLAGPVLRVAGPHRPDLEVAYPDGSELAAVSVFGHELKAAAADPRASAWFTELIGMPVRLVYLDDPTRRQPNPKYAEPQDRVSFADAYPVLLTSQASLDTLNDLIAGGPLAVEGLMPMVRFRPNIVISGAAAWAEDQWRRLRIGDVPFRAVKACDRCVVTTIDPWHATKGKEPIATLARHRKWDGQTWFGVNLVPDAPGTIRGGDAVEIVEASESAEPYR
jgi:uncharacterized protein